MKIKKEQQLREKGITLIALVITIIILLILAGITIGLVAGDNGILAQATRAKEETEIAEEKEEIVLAYNTAVAKKQSADITAEELDKELKANEAGATAIEDGDNIKVTFEESQREYIIDKNGNITEGTGTTPPAGDDNEATVGEIVQIGEGNKEYTNGEYTAIIPEGFMIVPGCEDISKGLVISDNPTDTEANSSEIIALGNQFVWIPVKSEAEYVRNTTYEDTNVSSTAYTDTGYLPEGIAPIIPEETTKAEDIGAINEKAEREAVVRKGGFYISRYEAGKEEENRLVSKKGATVWTGISQADCKTEAKKFINNENVKSALCSGIQWDVIMEFVDGKPDGENNIIDVTVNGNRGGSSASTSGGHKADRMCNIFDLEENYFEYVAEKNSYYMYSPFVGRGGLYNDGFPASYHGRHNGTANDNNSFRFTLYVM